MKSLAKIIAWTALAATILPACFFFTGKLDHATMRVTMNIAMVVWFIAAFFWMEHKVD